MTGNFQQVNKDGGNIQSGCKYDAIYSHDRSSILIDNSDVGRHTNINARLTRLASTNQRLTYKMKTSVECMGVDFHMLHVARCV